MTIKDSKQGTSAGEPTNTVKPHALKVEDACEYLGGISPSSVRRLINRKLLKPNRALRHLLIPVSELDRFLGQGHP
jgi:hypothetical protein